MRRGGRRTAPGRVRLRALRLAHGRWRVAPVRYGRSLPGWEPPPTPWSAGHRGVDLGSPAGRPVRAVAAGRVSFAGKVAGRGVLSIELTGTGDPPLRTTYEPVRPTVRKGDRVRAGETVGSMAGGPSHCSSVRAGGACTGALRRGSAISTRCRFSRRGSCAVGRRGSCPCSGSLFLTVHPPRAQAPGGRTHRRQQWPEERLHRSEQRVLLLRGSVGAGGVALTLALGGAAFLARRRLTRRTEGKAATAATGPRAPP